MKSPNGTYPSSRTSITTAVTHAAAALTSPLTAVAPARPAAADIRVATPADRAYVASLQKRYANQLGFLPLAAIDILIEQRRVMVGRENGDPAGYVVARPRLRCMTAVAPIVQTAVSYDLRRRRLGTALVEAVCADAWVDGRLAVQCWCREDLEACEFWHAAGFMAVADRWPGNARRKRMILYRRPLPGCDDATLTTVPRNAGWKGATIRPDRPPQLMLPFAVDGGH